jgi:hypothetical protein
VTLEPTAPTPKPRPNLEELRHHWVRTDVAAEALGLEEGTVRAWAGQRKLRTTWAVRPDSILVLFDDLEALVARLPTPTGRWDQDDLLIKQAGQMRGAITRLTNLLTDTQQADLFHEITPYRSPVDSIDIALWVLAQRAEAFRARLAGMWWERGYRIETVEGADPSAPAPTRRDAVDVTADLADSCEGGTSPPPNPEE